MAQRVSSRAALLAAVLLLMAFSAATRAATLDRIGQSHVVRIAYRADAPPFSYTDRTGAPAGFMVDLCKAVVEHLAQQLKLQPLNVSYVMVTAADRFDAISQGKADLLCEPTSSTLSRREQVDFSVATFVDGASLLVGPDGPRSLQEMSGRKIGVLAGTTTEQELQKSLSNAKIAADVVAAKTHAEGLAMLDDGRISAYFGDRAILWVLMANSKQPDRLKLADTYMSIETYALALPHGDEDYRLQVDRALSHIYGSGEITPIVTRTFGGNLQPGSTLQMLYLLSGLPD